MAHILAEIHKQTKQTSLRKVPQAYLVRCELLVHVAMELGLEDATFNTIQQLNRVCIG